MNALDRVKAAFPCVCGEDGRKTSIHANGCYSQCGRWNDIAAVVEAAERDAIERCAVLIDRRRAHWELAEVNRFARDMEALAICVRALKEPKP